MLFVGVMGRIFDRERGFNREGDVKKKMKETKAGGQFATQYLQVMLKMKFQFFLHTITSAMFPQGYDKCVKICLV